MKFYIGIDPGQKGGLSLITNDGKAVEYERMPETPGGIYQFFTDALVASENQLVTVMESGGGGGSAVGTFAAKSAGLYLGYFRMLCAVVGVPLHEVHPATWKANMRVRSAKDTSIRMAEQLFPTVNLLFPRCTKKHDGCAEALLIAEWGRRKGL
ncbi:MAG: hypothetical protein FD174_2597 [Geobacteraceae bacterium]|nr:MAG: hypothetical protein FD174_2597 [Geobacteraceae bacterium]